ncbi:hypothetical protein CYMTET_13957 [Cymbomonas tetramitiformis]|uniref:EF-hand domain-containing protein n=1 Tax=Cymbomonas tetramitiformis TaxID=36881 RepID=A0AAE0GHG9_9CHLO|nr:hypothetical protein CYMTET_13957 [Cymbomonas tetramitiformis]|eukprot:gene966-1484_t
MARLPPPRETYFNESIKKIFDGLDKGDGRLSYSELDKGLTGVDWAVTGLSQPVMVEALANEAKSNGDTLVNFDEFWNFCVKNGTGHQPDPAEIAKEYLMKHRILPLFETMTAALLYFKPDMPKKFLTDRLTRMKSGRGEVFFEEKDLSTMFNMFDITGRGTISVDQCNQALCTLLGPGKDVRDTLGESVRLLNTEQFTTVMKDALGAAAPVPINS